MNKIYSLLTALIMLAFTAACTPDDVKPAGQDIKAGDLVEGVAFSVTHDAANPNIIHLKSLLPTSYQVYWQHPQGQSQKHELDLKIAFNGSYEVTFGVITRGGLVVGEPYTFTVDDFCADFVTGEMWDLLTGGAGNSKTWVPDNGQYGMKQGYYSCFDPSAVWEDMTHTDGKNDWYAIDKTWWEPSNGDVGITDDDLAGSMTFSLDGAAKLSVTTVVGGAPVTVEGLFDMNADAHTINATNVDFLHAAWTDGKAKDFRNGFVILHLDENQLMIANHRDPVLSGEGDCLYCFNFVSKEWADSYVPPVVVDTPEPVLPEGWYDLLSNQLRYCQWALDADVPFDWCDLYGARKHTYRNSGDYPEASKPVEAEISMNLATDASDLFTFSANGTEVSGKFTLGSDGYLTFDTPLPSAQIGGNVEFATNPDNTLRVIGMAKDDLGRVSDLWLGRIEKDFGGRDIQYVGYHFIAQFGGASAPKFGLQLNYNNTSTWAMIEGEKQFIEGDGTYTLTVSGSNAEGDPCLWVDCFKILDKNPNCDVIIKDIRIDGTQIAFVDSDISRGAGDDPSTARRYICNPWGLAPCFPAASLFYFNNKIEVTVEVKFETGVPFITPEE